MANVNLIKNEIRFPMFTFNQRLQQEKLSGSAGNGQPDGPAGQGQPDGLFCVHFFIFFTRDIETVSTWHFKNRSRMFHFQNVMWNATMNLFPSFSSFPSSYKQIIRVFHRNQFENLSSKSDSSSIIPWIWTYCRLNFLLKAFEIAFDAISSGKLQQIENHMQQNELVYQTN